MFFLVSQVFSLITFGERPSASLVLGGGSIAAGGAVIQLAAK